MPAAVFEGIQALRVPLIRAIQPDELGYLSAAYPYAILESIGQADDRDLRTLVLENDALRVVIVPDLGGRIIEFAPKFPDAQGFTVDELTVTDDPHRGIAVEGGFRFTYLKSPRPNDAGPMLANWRDAPDEESPATVRLFEIGDGRGLGIEMAYALDSARAALGVRVRLHNRSDAVVPVQPAWIAPEPVAYRPIRPFGGTDFHLATAPVHLLPRQTLEWTFEVRPGLDGTAFVPSETIQAALSAGRLRLLSTIEVEGKVLLGLADGATLEAPLRLTANVATDFSLSDLPAAVVAVQVRDSSGRRIFSSDVAPGILTPPPARPLPAPADWPLHPEMRAYAAITEAERAIANGDWALADENLDRALTYDADDPLTWHAKALVARLSGEPVDETDPVLPNAHYLAPLEPLLRAEALMRQDADPSDLPSPVLEPLKDLPETLVEVAARLLDLEQDREAARWLEEALKHVDLPMLRYLYAFALLRSTRLEIEAAEQVGLAGRMGIAPPYPWRPIEIRALQTLAARFPGDQTLSKFVRLS